MPSSAFWPVQIPCKLYPPETQDAYFVIILGIASSDRPTVGLHVGYYLDLLCHGPEALRDDFKVLGGRQLRKGDLGLT